jgi:hypothetical protein
VKNISELADCPDQYVKLQGQGTYFFRSANWLSLQLCTWLAPSLPFEKCADQKLANVLFTSLSNPPEPRQGPCTSCFPVLNVCPIFRASLFFRNVSLSNLYKHMGIQREVLLWSNTIRFAITLKGYTTLGRTPLDEWSARRRDLYLTTQNTHNRQTSMSPAGFETALLASQRLRLRGHWYRPATYIPFFV